MTENINQISIMLFVLALFLIAIGIGLATVTQEVMRWGLRNRYEQFTIHPYEAPGGIMFIIGIIVLVAAFLETQTKPKAENQ